MSLKTICSSLLLELRKEQNMNVYENRIRQQELHRCTTPMSAAKMLSYRSIYRWEEKEHLLRELIYEQQSEPHCVWSSILVVGCCTMLGKIRYRAIVDDHCSDELDHAIIFEFLDVVHTYDLTKYDDRTYMWLRQGTQRRFFNRLKYERRLKDTELDFGAVLQEQLDQRVLQPDYNWLYANNLDWPDDPSPGKVPLTEDEKEDLQAFLFGRLEGLVAVDELELFITTRVQGETLQSGLDSLTQSPCSRQRKYQRIKRRHTRALEKVRHLLMQQMGSPLAVVREVEQSFAEAEKDQKTAETQKSEEIFVPFFEVDAS